jgi:hypothetical protein
MHLLQKKDPTFQFAVIEEIADNDVLVEQMRERMGSPTLSSPTAYFFYNFAYPTFSPKQVFILD